MKVKGILKKNNDFVARNIEESIVLMPIYKSSKDLDCIYTLNETAGAVWNLIDGRLSMDKIKLKILKDYNVSQDKLDFQVEELIKDLKKIKAIA